MKFFCANHHVFCENCVFIRGKIIFLYFHYKFSQYWRCHLAEGVVLVLFSFFGLFVKRNDVAFALTVWGIFWALGTPFSSAENGHAYVNYAGQYLW